MIEEVFTATELTALGPLLGGLLSRPSRHTRTGGHDMSVLRPHITRSMYAENTRKTGVRIAGPTKKKRERLEDGKFVLGR